jgi:tetratricopeptide (TPR) repeat protein
MKKFLHLVLITVALALAGTGCTAKMKQAYHQSRADKFFAAGNFDSAEIEYLRVLRADQENGKAFARLAEIYYQQGRIQLALPFLSRASAMMTNDLDLRLKLGRVLLVAGRTKEVAAAAGFILDQNPKSDEAPQLLAQAVNSTAEVAVARARLEKLVQAGDRAAYQVGLGMLAFRGGDPKAAEANFKRALVLDAKFPDALESLAAIQVSQGDLKSAAENFKAAADLSPVRSARRINYARFKMQSGEVAVARQILTDIITTAADYTPALLGLAEIALEEKKYDDARALLGKILGRDQENFEGMLLQSRLKFVQGDVGGCVVVLERMSKIYPQAARVHLQLGAACMANGDEAKASVSLARTLELDSNLPEAIMMMSQIQIKNQNPDPAIVSLTKLVQRQPKLSRAQLLLADAYRQRGRINEALAIYLALEKTEPKNPHPALLAGAAYVQLGDAAKARQAFERALIIAPDNLPALEQLVNLDLAGKNYPAALQRIQTRQQVVPDSVELMLLVAKVQLAQGDRAAVEKTVLKASSLDPKLETPYLLLAQLYLDAKQTDKAQQQLQLAVEKNPRNLSAMMLAASMSEAAKDYKAAAASYEKMLVVDPRCSPALNNLAYLYSEFLGQLDRAYDLAQRARELLPFDPSTADTLGWICYKRGAYPSALGLLTESAAKLSGQPEIQFHLGMAAYMTGNEADARAAFQRALSAGKEFNGREECQSSLAVLDFNVQTADAAAREKLEQHVAKNPADPVAQIRLGAMYQRDGSVEKAIASYEAVLKADPKNLTANNALTRLWEAKDVAKAYGLAKAAYKIAANDVGTAHDYGRLAYRNGDFKVADSMLQQTVQNQPGNARLQFDYARAAYSVGKIADAQSALQSALTIGLPPAETAEAKRMVELLTLSAEPQNAAATAATVASILQSEPDYVPALMAQAKLKELAGDAEAAAAACEKILARFADFSPAQRELAILYSRDAAKAKQAYALAVKARAVYPNDPALAKAIGITVFQTGDFARATSLLKDCAAKSPADAEIFYYLGAAQLKAGQLPSAKANLQQAITLKLAGSLADSARQLLGGIK